ncbi:glycosyltransferase family 2 protein [Metabacillus elymi]|uniref:Glycosyltransferase n=1 Tax=Metabacillus elymi TaxID=2745198 RepID=A0ABX6S355_9BACI|nr:glycosyltransferase family 2 protein [Metabacillus sp. KUDC1714]QNF28467.1 glycosyltransferase [Metabacillus sp. KUDC1714]
MMMNNNLPLVSIITPSYNQGKFIRETIESVLKQDYMKLEHIVIDGGSSDETLQILKEYSNLDSRFRFVSEPDNGQSHAINKGIKLAKGEVIGWLNSDDTYLPGAVNHVVNGFLQNPNWSMVYGSANITNVNNEILSKFVARRVRLNDLFTSCPICQPAVFLRKKTLNELGGIDESLDFCMDYDLWIRIAIRGYEMGNLNVFLANSRYYPESKSGSKYADVGFPEIIRTSKKHFGVVSATWLNLFLKHYRNKGVFWFIKLFKSFSIFDNSPNIKETNLIEKSWAPQNLQINIQNIPSKPLHSIIIKGIQEKFDNISCSFLINDLLIQKIKINKGPFEFQIPLTSKNTTNRFSIICDKSINVGMEHKIYKISEILPLSKEENEFMEEFEKGELYVKRWIKRYFIY